MSLVLIIYYLMRICKFIHVEVWLKCPKPFMVNT